MPCGHMASLMGWLEPGTIPCVCRWPWLNGEGELGPAWRLVALRPGEVVRVQRGCQKGISESMGQCGGWEEQAAVFVVIGCCLALAAWESPWIGQNRPSVTCLAQICYSSSLSQRWALGTFHLCPGDNLLLAGQRVYPFQTSFFLRLVLQRRDLLPGAGVRDLSTQEVATFGCLGAVAELEL